MYHELVTTAKQAASNAASVLSSMIGQAGVVSAVGKDIKTKADEEANDAIIRTLGDQYPIVSEEHQSALTDLENPAGCWIIDPLDGTFNFTRGFPIVAVSIAFWRDGQPVVGVVKDLFHGDTYWGCTAEGAYCNGQPIHVSNISNTKDAVIATGFPSGRSYASESLTETVAKVQNYKKVRMLGSAAMMLTYVSSGVFDAYEETDIYLWDVAAALALVKAAGGSYQIEPGNGQWKWKVQASNGCLA